MRSELDGQHRRTRRDGAGWRTLIRRAYVDQASEDFDDTLKRRWRSRLPELAIVVSVRRPGRQTKVLVETRSVELLSDLTQRFGVGLAFDT